MILKVCGQFTNLFLTLFLANIASRYVGEFIDEHVQRIRVKKKFDQELAGRLFAVCYSKNISQYMNDIYRGSVNRDKMNDLRTLLDLYQTSGFFKKHLQTFFDSFVINLEALSEFVFREFSVADHDSSLLKIHKYENAEDGHILYEKNLRKLNKILDDLDISAKNLEVVLVKSFPKLALRKLI